MVWTPAFPSTNWTLNFASGGGGPLVSGTNIVFTNLSGTSVVFAYTVNVPGNMAVSNTMSGSVTYRYQGSAGNNNMFLNALTIFRYHSADYSSPYRKISVSKITRMLNYWRSTGGYRPNPATVDGYEATTNLYTGPDTGRHSADYAVPYWKISVAEITRMLNYWRGGGYHVDLSTPDGYAAGTNGPGPR
jgi:hypothetical protein